MLKCQASQVAVVVKNPPANTEDLGEAGSIPGSGRSPGRGNGNPLQYLPGESHGQRSLAGYSPWGHKSWTRLSDYTTTTIAFPINVYVQMVLVNDDLQTNLTVSAQSFLMSSIPRIYQIPMYTKKYSEM